MATRLAPGEQAAPPNHLPVLLGELYNVETQGGQRLLFVSTYSVDERCLAAIRNLAESQPEAAILVIYMDGDPEQEAQALEAGADDCIGVSVDYRYFTARLRATILRLNRGNRRQRPTHHVEIDPLTHEAIANGCRTLLGALEFRLLRELRRQTGQVVPHEHLEMLIWGEASAHTRHSLKQLVYRL